jgi:hypothetical protein
VKRCLTGLQVVFVALTLVACENLVTDLPETDITQYILGNTVAFPKGTKAVDVYNTIAYLCPDNEYYNVNGRAEYWKDLVSPILTGDTNSNGTEDEGENLELITRELIVEQFSKVKHTHISNGDVHIHTVFLWASDIKERKIVFKWQRQTTNVWQNDVLLEDIVFTLSM